MVRYMFYKCMLALLDEGALSSSPNHSRLLFASLQIHAIVMTFESGILDGFPPTIVSELAPSLKNIHLAVMEHPKVW